MLTMYDISHHCPTFTVILFSRMYPTIFKWAYNMHFKFLQFYHQVSIIIPFHHYGIYIGISLATLQCQCMSIKHITFNPQHFPPVLMPPPPPCACKVFINNNNNNNIHNILYYGINKVIGLV